MKELYKRQEKFYSNWKEKREKKFRYIFLHGTVYWGIPMAILLFLVENHFKVENMVSSRFVFVLILFGIGGILPGLSQYKSIDYEYLKLIDDSDILKGIQILKAEKNWNYENLIINIKENHTLFVRNKLFWLDDSDALSENLEECLNIVMQDFQRLKKNPDFDVFSAEYRVKVQVYNNSEKEKPLIEMAL